MTVHRNDLVDLLEQAQAKLEGLTEEAEELGREYSDLQARMKNSRTQRDRTARTVTSLEYLIATLDFTDE